MKLDRFDGGKFRRREKKMHFLLTTLKVVYVLTTPSPEEKWGETLEQVRERIKWENDDYICRGHILNALSDALFDVYQNFEMAKELGDALHAKYLTDEATDRVSPMAEVAQACTQPACEIGKCLWVAIARRINYARKLFENWESLNKKAKDLRSKRDDIVAKIDRLNLQKTPTKECNDWRNAVAEMEYKIKTMEPEFNVDKKCVGGLCPDIFARIDLGERVVNMISEVNKLIDKKFESEFLVDRPPPKVVKKPETASKLSTSADLTLQMVLNKIRDASTPKIGIWGMGGIGKTTVLQILNNSPEVATLFDFVIWVTVSKSGEITTLQNEVGKRLAIEITNVESVDMVATKLFERLEGKKYLLLLDDVWDAVDLGVVGFPNANHKNGCKVVLTTRKKEVCRKMRTDVEIKVEALPEKEAWEMFSAEVGLVDMQPTIRDCANDIVKECAGLPLALKVVSSILRKQENENVWSDLLRQLRSPATSSIRDLEDVFRILKVSYDQLKDIEEQKCLLFCGLYPEEHKIEKSELIAYWRAEGRISRELTLAEAHAKGDAILQALIDASLLEKCDGDTHVKMHDVVRDLVLAMTAPNKGQPAQLVRAGISSEKMPEEVEWKEATRISFMDHDLHDLPESPDCPELLTLMLQGNKKLNVIPETFFNKMPKLRVLDVSRTGIKTFPASISKLDSLRELVLLDCNYLVALPEQVSALKELEVFLFNRTRISLSYFFHEKPLFSLKSVNRESIFPIGEICRLSQIKVFKYGDMLSDKSTAIIVKELSNLSSLSSLEFDFPGVGNLQHFLQNSRAWKERRLTQFMFFVGEFSCHSYRMSWASNYKRCLIYKGSGGEQEEERSNSGLPSAIEDALSRSNCFFLVGPVKLITLSKVGAHNTRELRFCGIDDCIVIENIVDRNGLQTGAFPNLQHLYLAWLGNLKSILCLNMEEEGPLLPPPSPNVNSFTNLTILEIRNCPLIEHLFSCGFMLQQLSNLEVLSIRNCVGLKGMIADGEKVEYEALPKLRVLSVERLSRFANFFKGVPMCWQSLKEVLIIDCPKLRKLPFDINSAPHLKTIKGNQWWWDALEWDNDAIKLQLHPLFRSA